MDVSDNPEREKKDLDWVKRRAREGEKESREDKKIK